MQEIPSFRRAIRQARNRFGRIHLELNLASNTGGQAQFGIGKHQAHSERAACCVEYMVDHRHVAE